MALGQTTFGALLDRLDLSLRFVASESGLQTGPLVAINKGARPTRSQLRALAPIVGMTAEELAVVLLTGEQREAASGADDHADH
jgi:hypothetical protein